MNLVCPSCRRVLEFSGERPSFCSYCGHSLIDTVLEPTAPGGPDAPTIVPADGIPVVEAVPEMIGGYRLLRPLGRGGMGTVYEAEDAGGRRVALKLVSPDSAYSREAVERFRQEGRLASGIAHPRCVFVLAADEEAGRPYIVMELMPGSTLADLVRERPLPAGDAVAKILDVIDGLEEAHRLGVIHRDVKPSNCFIDADGRVKIGDFGLAKSLGSDVQLTRTGSFLGTPLFASPEQIRHDPVDEQTDVYSVAATLYFLLTGQAPFQGKDAAATLARIVADPAPSMRTLRPEISPALDRVVLRGLERQRERRYRNLREFREALLPFLPGRLSATGLGARFIAFLVDFVVLKLLGVGLGIVELLLGILNPLDKRSELLLEVQLLNLLPWLVYFGLLEGRWGCSLGKWMLRLRVTATGGGPAGLARGLGRAAILAVLIHLGSLEIGLIGIPPTVRHAWHVRMALVPGLLTLLGVGLVFLPMRKRNGYRGLHEILSGTRVVRLPWPEPTRAAWGHVCDFALTQPEGMPEQVGPYRILGAVRWTPPEKVLLAEDPGLGRRAWVWVRPASEAPLSEARHATPRITRPRWLAGGMNDGQRWDALLLQAGCLLPELAAREGRLPWADVRPCLEQLTEELSAALKDHTLPASLDVHQVWVQPNGSIQLLDFLPAAAAPSDRPAEVRPTEADDGAALRLLRQTALLLLEGRADARTDRPRRPQAPLPGHAADLLGRLLDEDAPYPTVMAFQADLLRMRERAAEVERPRRTTQLTVQALLLSLGLACMAGASLVWSIQATLTLFFVGREAEWLSHQLEGIMVGDLLGNTAAPGPLSRPASAIQFEEDGRLREEMLRAAEKMSQWHDAWLRANSWTGRQLCLAAESAIEPQLTPQAVVILHDGHRTAASIRRAARKLPGAVDYAMDEESAAPVLGKLSLLILAWPALWIAWAFLVRGGLSYWIAGIRLVRANGRPAWRIQCAWRALLVWAPVAGLFVASLWLEAGNWPMLVQDQELPWWRPWLPGIVWWGAVLLLAGDVGLALWRPSRGPHDRLSGVYLVPR